MDVEIPLIAESWAALAGQRVELVRAFYERLFERFPKYRAMFPEKLDPQADRMVEMFSTVARYADHVDFVRPYLLEVSYAHRHLGLHEEDLRNFEDVFIETLAEKGAAFWTEEYTAAWREAFDDMIVPILAERLRA